MNEDPRNFFYNQRNGTGAEQNHASDAPKKTSSAKPTQEEINARIAEMRALAEKYNVQGESQLVRDIADNVIKQKASGQLTNDQLLAFAKRITPLLNAEQRQRLNSLIDELLKL